MSNITTQNNDISSWGNLDPSDFEVFEYRIVNGSAEGTKGYFRTKNGDERKDFRSCSVIIFNKRRVLFGKSKGKSLCGSDDYYQPAKRYEKPISVSCAHCFACHWDNELSEEDRSRKHKIWKDLEKPESNWYKPVCSERYSILMSDENGKLFFVSFGGTQNNFVKKNLISRLGSLYAASGEPTYSGRFDMSTEKKEFGDYSSYIPVFENFVENTDFDRDHNLWLRNSKTAQAKLSEEYAKQDEDKGDDDAIPF